VLGYPDAMSVPDGDLAADPPDAPVVPRPTPAGAPSSRDEHPTVVVCPYLAEEGGAWRSATPSRDHRCHAVSPPAQLAADKQRRLCLVADHVSCATYQAARAARAAALAPGIDPAVLAATEAARRPVPRATPVIVERPGFIASIPSALADRGLGQAALIALMVVALAAIVLARVVDVGRSTVPSPSPAVSPSPSRPPTPRPTPVPSSSSAAPSGSAAAAASSAVYRVKAGDTMFSIANQFGTTADAIRDLNRMADSNISVGQQLMIPGES
jgi:LysM repeat protein